MVLYSSMSTKQTHLATNLLEILHCVVYFLEYTYLSPVFWVPSETAYNGPIPLHSEHVYKDNFGFESSVRMNHCAIFGYSDVLQTLVFIAEHTVVLRFHTNQIMLKN